jgi:hypothetical protein
MPRSGWHVITASSMIDPHSDEVKELLAFHEGVVKERIVRQIEAMAKAETNQHKAMVITQVKNHIKRMT